MYKMHLIYNVGLYYITCYSQKKSCPLGGPDSAKTVIFRSETLLCNVIDRF